MRAIILALLTASVATPAMAADQFDLVCTGHHKTSPVGSWKPYEVHYRVDLVAKTWCRDSCSSVAPLASSDAARIEFASSNRNDTGGVNVIHYVDRSNGKWVYFIDSPTGLYENAEGQCEPAEFSGMPAPKF